jgi:hypothetical protein
MGTSISAWYLVFIARSNEYWWDHVFCRGKFKHVAALGYDPQLDQWYLYDHSIIGLNIYKMANKQLDNFLINIERRGGVVLKALPPKTGYRQICFPMATCVSAIKHLVKFKSWAFTPTQLFCAYTSAGASVSFVSSDDSAEKTNEPNWRSIVRS